MASSTKLKTFAGTLEQVCGQIASIAQAVNNTKTAYGFRVPQACTLDRAWVITNTLGVGSLETSTVKLTNGATVLGTLTTSAAEVGAGGTAQLAAGSKFVMVLNATPANLDLAAGDLLSVETYTAAGTEQIQVDTIVQFECSVRA